MTRYDGETEMLTDFLRSVQTQQTQDAAREANPRRVAAGRRNRCKRGPLTDEGRERLRAAARENRPWEHSTGPRTEMGKLIVSSNGKIRQMGEFSRRELKIIEQELMLEFQKICESRRRIISELEVSQCR